MIYPKEITPYTIEIEVTNYCNAKCIFCTNSTSKRKKGFINIKDLEKFIVKQKKLKKNNWFNNITGTFDFPKIVLAGLGEPLLHPQIFDIIRICKGNQFKVQLVTNGELLTKDVAIKLNNLDLDFLAISLHSLNPTIYKSITGLNLNNVLKNLTPSLEILSNSKIAVEIWRIKPPIDMVRETENDQINFQNFISKYPNIKVLGPSEPWERDGKVNSICDKVCDSDEIWCHKIYFTYNISWDGYIVLCCNDYNKISVDLGNAFYDENNFYINIKKDILFNRNLPEICKNCRRWKDLELQEIYEKNNINE